MIDYVDILKKPWRHIGTNFTYQNNCLRIPPADNGIWDLAFPQPYWNDQSLVVMHCQDFVNVDERGVRELQLMEQHFRQRSSQVVVVTMMIDLQERYPGPLHLAYFPSHTFNIIVNMRPIVERWQSQLHGTRTTKFQCLNGIPKPHRVRAIAALDQLPVKGHTSLGRDRELPIWPYYPTYMGCENEHNYLRLLPIYGDSDINVVTESLYEERPGVISEKTLFALMSLQVPILIGYAGMVSHVKSLGFDVFDDIVDTRYDWLPNDIRVEQAIQLNKTLLMQGFDRNQLAARLQKNLDLVLAWPEKMIKDYEDRCLEIQDSLTIS